MRRHTVGDALYVIADVCAFGILALVVAALFNVNALIANLHTLGIGGCP